MKGNNGWITLIICGSFAFTGIGYAYTTMLSKEIKAEHNEDIQVLTQKMDKLYDKFSNVDKKVTKIETLSKLILKDAYGIIRE